MADAINRFQVSGDRFSVAGFELFVLGSNNAHMFAVFSDISLMFPDT
jgi:hypothetical protein